MRHLPHISPPHWQEVAGFEGARPAVTPEFTIHSHQWRVYWTCKVTRKPGRFALIARGEDGVDQEMVDVAKSSHDMAYSYSGPRKFRLQVKGYNVEWTLRVEENLGEVLTVVK